MTLRQQDEMGMRKTRKQGAPIAELLARPRTTYGADQCVLLAGASFCSSLKNQVSAK
jgi:hypothetical protein